MKFERHENKTKVIARLTALHNEFFQFEAGLVSCADGSGFAPCVTAWQDGAESVRVMFHEMTAPVYFKRTEANENAQSLIRQAIANSPVDQAKGMEMTTVTVTSSPVATLDELDQIEAPKLPAKIARHCLAHVEGLKGKARDRACVTFFAGAAMALYATGDEVNGAWIYRVTALLVCSRGFAEVENLTS